MHIIIFDGWSMWVFARELSMLYEAAVTGQGSVLPDLPVQYADFAVWQREWLQGEVLEEQLRYWREQLAGAPAVSELPFDPPRAAVRSYRGRTGDFLMDATLAGRLREVSREHGVTLFMTLLAAFQVLLARYSGQDDIVVGTPVANRNREEIEGLIGFFVNTLALRTNLGGNPTFGELLAQVKGVCLGAYAHQDLPFERLVEELQPERSVSHTPLFQVMFGLQNVPAARVKLHNLQLEVLGSTHRTSTHYDLALFF